MMFYDDLEILSLPAIVYHNNIITSENKLAIERYGVLVNKPISYFDTLAYCKLLDIAAKGDYRISLLVDNDYYMVLEQLSTCIKLHHGLLIILTRNGYIEYFQNNNKTFSDLLTNTTPKITHISELKGDAGLVKLLCNIYSKEQEVTGYRYDIQYKDIYIDISSYILKTPISSMIDGYIISLVDRSPEILLNRASYIFSSQVVETEKYRVIGKVLNALSRDLMDMILQIERGGKGDDIRDISKENKKKLNKINSFTNPSTIIVPFDLKDKIDDFANTIELSYPKITVHAQYRAKDTIIMYNPDDLQTVFINLAINSYEGDASEIKIIVEETHSHFLLQFTDNGTGIPEWIYDRLFEPYTTSKDAHIGLGLFEIKNILAKNNSCIQISNVSQGVCVSLIIPKTQTETHITQKRILYAEPSDSIRNIYKGIISRLGIMVDTVQTYEDILLRKDDYNLLIIDTYFPAIDHPKIIYTSNTVGEKRRGGEVIYKPLDRTILEFFIKKMIC